MITATEHTAPVDEQTSLFYRAWLPPNAQKAVVMVHRGHEHSGRLVDVVDELALQETAVFAWDARGHGKSPGERGYAPSFSRVVKDLDVFVRYVSQQHGIAIEDEVTWPKGGKSIYFRDPSGNSAELVTPGVWGLPSGW